MTASPHDIDPARFLQDQLVQASPDLMRDMLSTFIGPYPRILDTGCDYAAVGSVAARRAS